jgi:hypothetical protein
VEHTDLSLEQARLRADMNLVRTYGQAHPEDWAEVSWNNEPVVRFVVRFVDNVDEHRRALLERVEHPDRLEVARARFTDARLSEVMAEIQSAYSGLGALKRFGPRGNRLRMLLTASAASTAEELHRRYGDLVVLTVGALPYPLDGATARSVPEPPVTSGSLPARLELVLDDTTVSAGADLRGVLHITNLSDAELAFMTGILVGWVYKAGGARPVSTYIGARTGQGLGVRLAPGETSTRPPVLLGTASYDPAVGYCLTPGAYEAMTVLECSRPIGVHRERFSVRSPHTALTVT